MRPVTEEQKRNCRDREAVETASLPVTRVITGLKSGVNERTFSLNARLAMALISTGL